MFLHKIIMKVPLPKQSFAAYILTNTKIPYPISIYFGHGSRIKPVSFVHKYNSSPNINFKWFHGVEELDKCYSTKFITNIYFNNLHNEYKLKEEIVHMIPKYNLYKNSTLHTINYKYIFEDKIACNNLLSYNKENITALEIKDDLLSEDKIFNMEQSVKNIMEHLVIIPNYNNKV